MTGTGLSVACGLTAALCWGISDWLARGLSSTMGSFRAQLWSQLAGMVALTIAVIVTGAGADAIAEGTPRAWVFSLLYASIIGVAALAFFEAFGRGSVAVVAPIVGAYGTVTIGWTVAFGGTITPWVMAGLATVIIGVVLVSIPGPGGHVAGHRRGAIAAVVAAVLFGTAFFILGREVVPTMGSLVPALLSRVVGPVVLGSGALLVGVSVQGPPRPQLRPVVFSGVLASTATVATGVGTGGGDSTVVAVLGSLSVVVTVLIAMVALRERLARHQWLGVIVALVGIPLLASAGG